MRGIARGLRSRLAKMEGSCQVGEFDHMSLDEVQDYCDQQIIEYVAEFDGKADAFINAIDSDADWPLRNVVASSCQLHMADMRKRGLQI